MAIWYTLILYTDSQILFVIIAHQHCSCCVRFALSYSFGSITLDCFPKSSRMYLIIINSTLIDDTILLIRSIEFERSNALNNSS